MRKLFLNYKINNRGAILIYLLILISVLFFLIFHAIFYSKLNYKLAINYVKKNKDYENIKYITIIIGDIIKNQNLYNDFFDEGFLNFYKKRNKFKVDSKVYYLKVEKEDDKVNLNYAGDNAIKEKILKTFEDDFSYQYLDSISDKILDWRDKDNYVRLHGAEKEDYKDYGYFPKNDKFSSIFELLYVKDMQNKLFFNYNKKDKTFNGLVTIFTIYPKGTYRIYLWENDKLFIIFFTLKGKSIKIFDYRELV